MVLVLSSSRTVPVGDVAYQGSERPSVAAADCVDDRSERTGKGSRVGDLIARHAHGDGHEVGAAKPKARIDEHRAVHRGLVENASRDDLARPMLRGGRGT
jgi:hypothetical protein